jgi:LysM repeat protein
VKQGENLAAIAYQFNCTPAEIKKWNRLRSGKIAPGRKLVIVSTITEKVAVAKSNEGESEGTEQLNAVTDQSSDTADATATAARVVPEQKVRVEPLSTVQPKSKYIIYVVQPGDTLSSIAKRYDVANISQLKAVNRIAKGRHLKAGTKLRVPVSS